VRPLASESLARAVAEYWEREACGEVYGRGDALKDFLDSHARTRYALEPYIADFADYDVGRGRDVLEIGVGMGADHLEWARRAPATLVGVDLTARAVATTRSRLALHGFAGQLQVANAEQLPLPDNAFDIVYSWGVLHHSPDTPRAVAEVRRVLRPGGVAKVMIYHRQAIVGYALWTRYALLAGRPFRSLDSVYAQHLESPGTKAYSIEEARDLFSAFAHVALSIRLSVGDLMEGAAGQRHQGPALALARALWPRRIIRRYLAKRGLFLLVAAVK